MKVGIKYGKILDIFKSGKRNFEIVEFNSFDEEKIEHVDIIVSGKLTNAQLQKAKNLKHIFIPFTGKNGYDLEKVNELGIKIHVTQAHSKFVAERALSLALNLLGKITYYNNEMHEGRWGDRNFDTRVSWTSLFDKKVGIYGYGVIGKYIHKLVTPFSTEVYAYNRSRKEDVSYVDSLNELVDKSDIIFIAVPLTKETRGSFNKEHLDKMTNKYLINVARGTVVEEESLYNALKNGTLAGYGSDVWYNYPKGGNQTMPSNYPIERYNVVMTPHCGGFADNSAELRYIDTLKQVIKICES